MYGRKRIAGSGSMNKINFSDLKSRRKSSMLGKTTNKEDSISQISEADDPVQSTLSEDGEVKEEAKTRELKKDKIKWSKDVITEGSSSRGSKESTRNTPSKSILRKNSRPNMIPPPMKRLPIRSCDYIGTHQEKFRYSDEASKMLSVKDEPKTPSQTSLSLKSDLMSDLQNEHSCHIYMQAIEEPNVKITMEPDTSKLTSREHVDDVIYSMEEQKDLIDQEEGSCKEKSTIGVQKSSFQDTESGKNKSSKYRRLQNITDIAFSFPNRHSSRKHSLLCKDGKKIGKDKDEKISVNKKQTPKIEENIETEKDEKISANRMQTPKIEEKIETEKDEKISVNKMQTPKIEEKIETEKGEKISVNKIQTPKIDIFKQKQPDDIVEEKPPYKVRICRSSIPKLQKSKFESQSSSSQKISPKTDDKESVNIFPEVSNEASLTRSRISFYDSPSKVYMKLIKENLEIISQRKESKLNMKQTRKLKHPIKEISLKNAVKATDLEEALQKILTQLTSVAMAKSKHIVPESFQINKLNKKLLEIAQNNKALLDVIIRQQCLPINIALNPEYNSASYSYINALKSDNKLKELISSKYTNANYDDKYAAKLNQNDEGSSQLPKSQDLAPDIDKKKTKLNTSKSSLDEDIDLVNISFLMSSKFMKDLASDKVLHEEGNSEKMSKSSMEKESKLSTNKEDGHIYCLPNRTQIESANDLKSLKRIINDLVRLYENRHACICQSGLPRAHSREFEANLNEISRLIAVLRKKRHEILSQNLQQDAMMNSEDDEPTVGEKTINFVEDIVEGASEAGREVVDKLSYMILGLAKEDSEDSVFILDEHSRTSKYIAKNSKSQSKEDSVQGSKKNLPKTERKQMLIRSCSSSSEEERVMSERKFALQVLSQKLQPSMDDIYLELLKNYPNIEKL